MEQPLPQPPKDGPIGTPPGWVQPTGSQPGWQPPPVRGSFKQPPPSRGLIVAGIVLGGLFLVGVIAALVDPHSGTGGSGTVPAAAQIEGVPANTSACVDVPTLRSQANDLGFYFSALNDDEAAGDWHQVSADLRSVSSTLDEIAITAQGDPNVSSKMHVAAAAAAKAADDIDSGQYVTASETLRELRADLKAVLAADDASTLPAC